MESNTENYQKRSLHVVTISPPHTRVWKMMKEQSFVTQVFNCSGPQSVWILFISSLPLVLVTLMTFGTTGLITSLGISFGLLTALLIILLWGMATKRKFLSNYKKLDARCVFCLRLLNGHRGCESCREPIPFTSFLPYFTLSNPSCECRATNGTKGNEDDENKVLIDPSPPLFDSRLRFLISRESLRVIVTSGKIRKRPFPRAGGIAGCYSSSKFVMRTKIFSLHQMGTK